MSIEKQIDEIETILCCGCQDIPVKVCHNRGLSCDRCRAEMIYNAGYRKQSEGEWIAKGTMIRTPSAKNYNCSVCGNESAVTTQFCPNCGAHMKGGAE